MAKQSHTPSRRAMLAGLAAAPVAGLPAIAGGVATDDPIFAAIAEHRFCKARAEAALASLNGKFEELEAAKDRIAVIRFTGEKFQSTAALVHFVNVKRALSGDEITEFFEAREALQLHEAAFERVREESGYAKAEDAFSEMNAAYCKSETAALAAQPTTAAGALALLALLAEHLEGPHCDPGENYPHPVLGAVRNALSVLQREALS